MPRASKRGKRLWQLIATPGGEIDGGGAGQEGGGEGRVGEPRVLDELYPEGIRAAMPSLA